MGKVIDQKRQRLVTLALVVGAGIALGIGALYQGDRLPDEPTNVIVGEGSGAGGAPAAPADDEPAPVSPIEGFLPRSGEASACREPVGVDLIPGYAATLTINGVRIAPEQMNVITDEEGEITGELTATRSLSQYTFGPEADCPNGEILRATNNVMQACVYRLEDGPGSCVVTEITFDVL